MKSRWYEYKPEALRLRKKGLSIKHIRDKLGVPLSTLSGWLKNVELTKTQKQALHKRWLNSLVKARTKAVLWHNEQKKLRLKNAENQAKRVLARLDVRSKDILDIALALLYLGEGSKKTEVTSIGNSDPLILKFFITVLRNNYDATDKNIKCELHLRADQDIVKVKNIGLKN